MIPIAIVALIAVAVVTTILSTWWMRLTQPWDGRTLEERRYDDLPALTNGRRQTDDWGRFARDHAALQELRKRDRARRRA